MANKALARRQKLVFRIEPSQKAALGKKPRNPVAVAAHQRNAGPHRKTASSVRNTDKRLIGKSLGKEEAAERAAVAVKGEEKD
ncbi:MAG: hypothetical protein JWR22_3061 [Herminiimonas sp.]|nr:hypothetical protein [Herminiimonas sp.]